MADRPSTIFVVDDDVGLLRLIEKALRREGFSTATAASGREAITWLMGNSADLMLLDLKLPDIDAKELILHLGEVRRRIPFVIITGQGDERVAVDMMKRGALDYLVKDVAFLQFLPEVVKRVVAQIETDRKLAAAEKAIVEISEREQQRIGHDLHDGLGQHLAGIELMSQVLEQNLASKKLSEAGHAGEIAKHVREAISQTRLLARGLSPVVLESEGLMSALRELAASTKKRFGVNCRFQCKHPVLVEDHAAATHLYRIAQEAISNAVRHGKATNVRIELVSANDCITLTVSDDGAGFAGPSPDTQGMGLRIMQYRARLIGGTLQVKSEPRQGTTISVAVPQSWDEAASI